MIKKVILASTSTLYGEEYLAYLLPSIKDLFRDVPEIVFIPYARPGGISHDEYTGKVAAFFSAAGIRVKGLHSYVNPIDALEQGRGFFTGGGNTFLLVKQLHELGLMNVLKQQTGNGKPYLGTSAGSNIGGVTMQTTNDMPIVYPPSLETMGLVPFNLNAHYQDPVPGIAHMGETRETRIKEFHTQNNIPVLGLREGSWISINGPEIKLEGTLSARIFEQGKDPYELPPSNKIAFT